MTSSNQSLSEPTALPWSDYRQAGLERARKLACRGPLRFDATGRLAQDILDAYNRNGFYVFTGVVSAEEVAELKAEFDEVLENAPVSEGSAVDKHGRPVKFPGYYSLASAEMFQLENTESAAVGLVSHPFMMMDSAVRVYGHPQILRMVESLNGPDFVPFHEAVFHKGRGNGPATPWHQDGRTHWTADGESLEQLDGSGKTHGFNLSVSWSHCTPENCLWVVPGSHRRWLLANGGKFPPVAEQLPNAVPMTLEPGDCGLVNRSSLHGAYPNQSSERRVTMVLGFHNRASAIGEEVSNVHALKRPGEGILLKYSEDFVLRRTRMIPLAIDARRQRYPDEVPYEYKGTYIGDSAWNEQTRAEVRKDGDEYWLRDITL